MRAYISLANFTCALLPLCGPSKFKGWSYLLTLELVSASGQRPLLSGFYRMLKVTLALTAATGMLDAAGGFCNAETVWNTKAQFLEGKLVLDRAYMITES